MGTVVAAGAAKTYVGWTGAENSRGRRKPIKREQHNFAIFLSLKRTEQLETPAFTAFRTRLFGQPTSTRHLTHLGLLSACYRNMKRSLDHEELVAGVSGQDPLLGLSLGHSHHQQCRQRGRIRRRQRNQRNHRSHSKRGRKRSRKGPRFDTPDKETETRRLGF
ncbi:hypothetical protein BC830DRAFT_35221 [Chytriomyces sp. MP71]|nr:hypothetical protein BC830DRAFT_35221 [Chytriomyces sp. MP71]